MTINETSAKKDYEAVVETAIKELTALGEEISVKEVIKLTGGSRRDIAPAVSRVKNRLRRRERRIWSAPDIPAAVQDLGIRPA
ncbi:DNA-binding protein [Paracoccus actinidiae]|uniref:DNA-binding protein n=1 Tax=Paracoccus actinidiae TaxID=3064531 RepID=UPI0027D2C25B|nr:DNA-binding protein [Paracoccus sp. M09]